MKEGVESTRLVRGDLLLAMSAGYQEEVEFIA
jgi:hypothetical protein